MELNVVSTTLGVPEKRSKLNRGPPPRRTNPRETRERKDFRAAWGGHFIRCGSLSYTILLVRLSFKASYEITCTMLYVHREHGCCCTPESKQQNTAVAVRARLFPCTHSTANQMNQCWNNWRQPPDTRMWVREMTQTQPTVYANASQYRGYRLHNARIGLYAQATPPLYTQQRQDADAQVCKIPDLYIRCLCT